MSLPQALPASSGPNPQRTSESIESQRSISPQPMMKSSNRNNSNNNTSSNTSTISSARAPVPPQSAPPLSGYKHMLANIKSIFDPSSQQQLQEQQQQQRNSLQTSATPSLLSSVSPSLAQSIMNNNGDSTILALHNQPQQHLQQQKIPMNFNNMQKVPMPKMKMMMMTAGNKIPHTPGQPVPLKLSPSANVPSLSASSVMLNKSNVNNMNGLPRTLSSLSSSSAVLANSQLPTALAPTHLQSTSPTPLSMKVSLSPQQLQAAMLAKSMMSTHGPQIVNSNIMNNNINNNNSNSNTISMGSTIPQPVLPHTEQTSKFAQITHPSPGMKKMMMMTTTTKTAITSPVASTTNVNSNSKLLMPSMLSSAVSEIGSVISERSFTPSLHGVKLPMPTPGKPISPIVSGGKKIMMMHAMPNHIQTKPTSSNLHEESVQNLPSNNLAVDASKAVTEKRSVEQQQHLSQSLPSEYVMQSAMQDVFNAMSDTTTHNDNNNNSLSGLDHISPNRDDLIVVPSQPELTDKIPDAGVDTNIQKLKQKTKIFVENENTSASHGIKSARFSHLVFGGSSSDEDSSDEEKNNKAIKQIQTNLKSQDANSISKMDSNAQNKKITSNNEQRGQQEQAEKSESNALTINRENHTTSENNTAVPLTTTNTTNTNATAVSNMEHKAAQEHVDNDNTASDSLQYEHNLLGIPKDEYSAGNVPHSDSRSDEFDGKHDEYSHTQVQRDRVELNSLPQISPPTENTMSGLNELTLSHSPPPPLPVLLQPAHLEQEKQEPQELHALTSFDKTANHKTANATTRETAETAVSTWAKQTNINNNGFANNTTSTVRKIDESKRSNIKGNVTSSTIKSTPQQRAMKLGTTKTALTSRQHTQASRMKSVNTTASTNNERKENRQLSNKDSVVKQRKEHPVPLAQSLNIKQQQEQQNEHKSVNINNNNNNKGITTNASLQAEDTSEDVELSDSAHDANNLHIEEETDNNQRVDDKEEESTPIRQRQHQRDVKDATNEPESVSSSESEYKRFDSVEDNLLNDTDKCESYNDSFSYNSENRKLAREMYRFYNALKAQEEQKDSRRGSFLRRSHNNNNNYNNNYNYNNINTGGNRHYLHRALQHTSPRRQRTLQHWRSPFAGTEDHNPMPSSGHGQLLPNAHSPLSRVNHDLPRHSFLHGVRMEHTTSSPPLLAYSPHRVNSAHLPRHHIRPRALSAPWSDTMKSYNDNNNNNNNNNNSNANSNNIILRETRRRALLSSSHLSSAAFTPSRQAASLTNTPRVEPARSPWRYSSKFTHDLSSRPLSPWRKPLGIIVHSPHNQSVAQPLVQSTRTPYNASLPPSHSSLSSSSSSLRSLLSVHETHRRASLSKEKRKGKLNPHNNNTQNGNNSNETNMLRANSNVNERKVRNTSYHNEECNKLPQRAKSVDDSEKRTKRVNNYHNNKRNNNHNINSNEETLRPSSARQEVHPYCVVETFPLHQHWRNKPLRQDAQQEKQLEHNEKNEEESNNVHHDHHHHNNNNNNNDHHAPYHVIASPVLSHWHNVHDSPTQYISPTYTRLQKRLAKTSPRSWEHRKPEQQLFSYNNNNNNINVNSNGDVPKSNGYDLCDESDVVSILSGLSSATSRSLSRRTSCTENDVNTNKNKIHVKNINKKSSEHENAEAIAEGRRKSICKLKGNGTVEVVNRKREQKSSNRNNNNNKQEEYEEEEEEKQIKQKLMSTLPTTTPTTQSASKQRHPSTETKPPYSNLFDNTEHEEHKIIDDNSERKVTSASCKAWVDDILANVREKIGKDGNVLLSVTQRKNYAAHNINAVSNNMLNETNNNNNNNNNNTNANDNIRQNNVLQQSSNKKDNIKSKKSTTIPVVDLRYEFKPRINDSNDPFAANIEDAAKRDRFTCNNGRNKQSTQSARRSESKRSHSTNRLTSPLTHTRRGSSSQHNGRHSPFATNHSSSWAMENEKRVASVADEEQLREFNSHDNNNSSNKLKSMKDENANEPIQHYSSPVRTIVINTPELLPLSFYSTIKVKNPHLPSAWARAPPREKCSVLPGTAAARRIISSNADNALITDNNNNNNKYNSLLSPTLLCPPTLSDNEEMNFDNVTVTDNRNNNGDEVINDHQLISPTKELLDNHSHVVSSNNNNYDDNNNSYIINNCKNNNNNEVNYNAEIENNLTHSALSYPAMSPSPNHILVEEVHLDEHGKPYIVIKEIPKGEAAQAQREICARLAMPRPVYVKANNEIIANGNKVIDNNTKCALQL